MKIGNGSLLEFILALFFLSVGLNSSTNIYVSVFVVAISLIVIIHSIYLLIKKIKSKNNNDKTSNQEKNNNTLKPKMVYCVILIVSLILNFILISSIALVFNKEKTNNNDLERDIKNLKQELEMHKDFEEDNGIMIQEKHNKDGSIQNIVKKNCVYQPVGGISKIRIAGNSADETVGGTFSRMNSDKSYLMKSNNPGEIYDVIMKFSGNSNIYECDEDWYLIETSSGGYGYVWGGYKSMYVQEQ